MQSRRQFLARTSLIVGSALASKFMATPARAQAKSIDGWPARNVTVIAPSGTTGPSGNFRLYAEQLQPVFGQPFVLEAVPGASGAIGLRRVLRDEADGHTLLVAANSSLILAPLVVPNFGVSLEQFEPIAELFRFRLVLLANPSLNVRTLAEFINYGKKNPGKLNFGSPGLGTGGHLITEFMLKRTGIEAVHIPYQTAAQQMMDTVSGTLQFTFDTLGNSSAMMQAGKLIPLAVIGAKRAEAAPNIPTFLELGYPGFENLFVSVGLLGKRGISPAVVTALNAQISRHNGGGAIADKLKSMAYELHPGSPQAYLASLLADRATWTSVVREIGYKPKPQ